MRWFLCVKQPYRGSIRASEQPSPPFHATPLCLHLLLSFFVFFGFFFRNHYFSLASFKLYTRGCVSVCFKGLKSFPKMYSFEDLHLRQPWFPPSLTWQREQNFPVQLHFLLSSFCICIPLYSPNTPWVSALPHCQQAYHFPSKSPLCDCRCCRLIGERSRWVMGP